MDKAIIYLYISIRLKMFLTLPVRVSGAERSFPTPRRRQTWMGPLTTWTKKDLTELLFPRVHAYTDIKTENII